MEIELTGDALADVLRIAEQCAEKWKDTPEMYWVSRLNQEVNELEMSLIGEHDDPPEHELIQIASIALNMLKRRYARQR